MRGLWILLFLLPLVTWAAPGQPADEPLGGPLIAFETAEQDGIMLLDVTSGARRELQVDRRAHRLMDFSPDGCRVLFTLTAGDGLGQLYSMALDGTDVRQQAQLDAGLGVWDARWSPAGDRVAFTVYALEDDGDGVPLHRIGWAPAGGGPAAYYSVTGDEHNPQWSPDGAWLAYVSYTPGQGAAPGRDADLWVVSADGQTKVQLTDFPGGSVHTPRWSPDGALIGFLYSPTPNADQFWMIANAAGAIPTQLSYETVQTLDMTWLPDGTAMLAAARNMQGVAENRLWQIPLVGNADVDARLYLDPPDLIYPYAPRFSSDGRYLAARSAYALAIFDFETGALTIVPDSLGNSAPLWSPAGFMGEESCQPAPSG